MPLDPKAVAAANQQFYAAHPERQGRPLTQNPEDAGLRDQWAKDYNRAKTGAPPPPEAQSTQNACDPAKGCPLQKPPEPRRYLCVHSNVAIDQGDPGLIDGHSMLSLHEGDKVTTYGAWPDSHPDIQKAGLANGAGTDVRTNFSRDRLTDDAGTSQYPYSRCHELTAAEYQKFQGELAKPFDWQNLHNCSSFASQTYTATTGEKVSASDKFGIPTPRALGKYINDLNAGPVAPAKSSGGGSSF